MRPVHGGLQPHELEAAALLIPTHRTAGARRAVGPPLPSYHPIQERVELLGAVSHCDVPRVLTRGHIFLNTSLTEACNHRR